jgi:hypothetical protein
MSSESSAPILVVLVMVLVSLQVLRDGKKLDHALGRRYLQHQAEAVYATARAEWRS